MRDIPVQALQNKLRVTNPHWTSGTVDPALQKLRRRRYFDLLFPLVAETTVNRAIVLMGPRRVGKTVLLHQVIQELLNRKAPPDSIVYFSLDTPILQGQSLEQLVHLYLECSGRNSVSGCTIIFDEVQYHPDWSRHLKVLVDQHKDARFIASGSAAAALRLKSLESGAGRFTDFKLPPLTFYEYLNLLDLAPQIIGPDELANLNEQFLRYVNFGGYPEAIFDPEIQEDPERFIRSDIIEKVLLKDLPSLYGITDIRELNRLFNNLAYQTGQEVTYASLASSSEIAGPTIKRYLEYLESAFLLKCIRRIDDSPRTFKKTNFFKPYLTNPSMYAALFGLVSELDTALGPLIETAVACQWLHSEKEFEGMHYARWSGGRGEVDIVWLDRLFKVDSCIEVKWSDRYLDQPSELKSLLHFCKKTGLRDALVTTKSRIGRKDVKGIQLTFVPAAILCYGIGLAVIEGRGRYLREQFRIPEEFELAHGQMRLPL